MTYNNWIWKVEQLMYHGLGLSYNDWIHSTKGSQSMTPLEFTQWYSDKYDLTPIEPLRIVNSRYKVIKKE